MIVLWSLLISVKKVSSSLTVPVQMRNISSMKRLKNKIGSTNEFWDLAQSLNILSMTVMKMFAIVGADLVPLSYTFNNFSIFTILAVILALKITNLKEHIPTILKLFLTSLSFSKNCFKRLWTFETVIKAVYSIQIWHTLTLFRIKLWIHFSFCPSLNRP